MRLRSILWIAAFGVSAAADMGVALHAEGPTAIFVMNIDGSNVRRVAQIEGYRRHRAPRWSRDGKSLAFEASKTPDGPWQLFSLGVNGAGLSDLGLGAQADWSPDDKQLAFSIGAGSAAKERVWVQNADGRGRQPLSVGRAPRWSPDGSRLALVNDGALVIVDLVVGGDARLSDASVGQVQGGFDWSPDGEKLALVASRDGRQQLWIVETAQPKAAKRSRLSGNLDGYVAWSPDGQRLAVVLDGQIGLLTVGGTTPPELIPGQQGGSATPDWSPDGKLIAFSSDRTAPAGRPISLVRPPIKLDEVTRHDRGNVVYSLAFTADGRRAVLGGDERQRNLRIWDIGGEETRTYDYIAVSVAVSPSGSMVAIGGITPKLQLVNADTGKSIRDLHSAGMTLTMDFAPDGRRLLSGSVNTVATVWDVATGREICRFKNHGQPLTRVVFSPNGKEAISAGQDKTLRIWNAETGDERLAILHPEVVWGLAVSPDGRTIATGTGGRTTRNPVQLRILKGDENVVRLWDASSGELIRQMKGHENVVYALDFSPDGRTLASGGWDGTIRLWDVQSGEELASVTGNSSAFAVAFSPDGSQLLVGGGCNRFAEAGIRRFPDEQVRLYRLVEDRDAMP